MSIKHTSSRSRRQQRNATHPLTEDKPKVLVGVNGTPLIQDVFDNLIHVGATELVVGYRAEQVIDRYGEEYEGVPITYAHQRQ